MRSYKIVLNDKAPKPYVNENIPLNQLMKMKPTMFLFRKNPLQQPRNQLKYLAIPYMKLFQEKKT